MRKCPKCKLTQPSSAFHKNPTNLHGLACWCKKCMAISGKNHYQKNKARIRAQHKHYNGLYTKETTARSRLWQKANPARYKDIVRKHLFGLEYGQFDKMFVAQKGKCGICDLVMLSPNIDHDHRTGEVRGLLCRGCNYGLGNFKDSPIRLRRAAEYLEKQTVNKT